MAAPADYRQGGDDKYHKQMPTKFACHNPECGRSDLQLLLCSQCQSAWYCSHQCQAKEWPNHAQVCRAPVPTSTKNMVSLGHDMQQTIFEFLNHSELTKVGVTNNSMKTDVEKSPSIKRVQEAMDFFKSQECSNMVRDSLNTRSGLKLIAQHHITVDQLRELSSMRFHDQAARSTRVKLIHGIIRDGNSASEHALNMFASGILTMSRFEDVPMDEWDQLLHKDVLAVMQSGWLKEDLLFRLHHTPSSQYPDESLLLMLLDQTFPHGLIPMDDDRNSAGMIRYLAFFFLPLTHDCISYMENRQNGVHKAWIPNMLGRQAFRAHVENKMPPIWTVKQAGIMAQEERPMA